MVAIRLDGQVHVLADRCSHMSGSRWPMVAWLRAGLPVPGMAVSSAFAMGRLPGARPRRRSLSSRPGPSLAQSRCSCLGRADEPSCAELPQWADLAGGPGRYGPRDRDGICCRGGVGQARSAAARTGADLGQMGRFREARRTGSVPGTSGRGPCGCGSDTGRAWRWAAACRHPVGSVGRPAAWSPADRPAGPRWLASGRGQAVLLRRALVHRCRGHRHRAGRVPVVRGQHSDAQPGARHVAGDRHGRE